MLRDDEPQGDTRSFAASRAGDVLFKRQLGRRESTATTRLTERRKIRHAVCRITCALSRDKGIGVVRLGVALACFGMVLSSPSFEAMSHIVAIMSAAFLPDARGASCIDADWHPGSDVASAAINDEVARVVRTHRFRVERRPGRRRRGGGARW
jgi:hypothetical protein